MKISNVGFKMLLALFMMIFMGYSSANNHFIFPFEINQAINGLNMKLKNVNLNELGMHELRSVWHRFTFERLLNLDLHSIESTARLYSRADNNITLPCRAEIYKIAKAIVSQEMWAYRGIINVYKINRFRGIFKMKLIDLKYWIVWANHHRGY